jgi:hypothetical protein
VRFGEVAGYRLFLLLFLMHMLTQGARWFYKCVPYIALTYVYYGSLATGRVPQAGRAEEERPD